MKIKVERRELTQALEPVSKLAKRSASMEILAHTLITASEGKILVKGTNLDTFMSKQVKAEVKEAGKCTIDIKKLLAMLKADRSEEVSIETAASDRVKVDTENISAMLSCLDAEQYPVFDQNIKFWFDTDPMAFLKDINCVINASHSGKGNKEFLATALLETRDGKLLISASDAKIILRITREVVSENKGALIPSNFLKLLSGSIEGESVVIGTSGENENLVCFRTDDCHISSRLHEHRFPDMDALITPFSSSHNCSLDFKREDMEYISGVMKPVALGLEKAVVKMRLDGDILHIGHKNDTGSIVSDMEVQNADGGFTFFWQLDYIEKLLAGMSQHDVIHLGLQNEISPIYFRNEGDLVTEALVMPIKGVTWMEDL